MFSIYFAESVRLEIENRNAEAKEESDNLVIATPDAVQQSDGTRPVSEKRSLQFFYMFTSADLFMSDTAVRPNHV